MQLVSLQVKGKPSYFMVDHGRLRRIRTAKALSFYKSYTPASKVSKLNVAHLKKGADMPWVLEERPDTPLLMRDWVLRECTGEGLEFGAGYAPGRFPLGTQVQYVDRFSDDEMAAKSSAARVGDEGANREPVSVDWVDSFQSMETIPAESQDFIYAAHVIEHVPDPIGAILQGLGRLRKGGRFVLVVPHRDRTFDRARPVTSIGHLVSDHLFGANSFEHCVDRLAYCISPNESLVKLVEQAKIDNKAMIDMHHHTFTPTSFEILLKYVKEVSEFTDFDIDDGAGQNGIEFYVTLVK